MATGTSSPTLLAPLDRDRKPLSEEAEAKAPPAGFRPETLTTGGCFDGGSAHLRPHLPRPLLMGPACRGSVCWAVPAWARQSPVAAPQSGAHEKEAAGVTVGRARTAVLGLPRQGPAEAPVQDTQLLCLLCIQRSQRRRPKRRRDEGCVGDR